MSQLSRILRDGITSSGIKILSFKCPGCKSVHGITVSGSQAWGWNGDVDKPTFTPSVLVRSGHYASHAKPEDHCWCKHNAEHPDDPISFKCGICHSFVTAGRIQFLNDCTHELAGQTVDLPDWEQE